MVATAVGVEGRGGGSDPVTRGKIGVGGDSIARETKAVGAGIGGARFAGVEGEVGVAHLAPEVVTLVSTDGSVVSVLLELDFMSCCRPFITNNPKP